MRQSLIGVVLLGRLIAVTNGLAAPPLEPKNAAVADPPKPVLTPAEEADRLADQLKKNPVPCSKEADRLAGFLLDTKTGEVTRFVDQPEPGLLHCGSAEWTHDGKRILFDAMPAPGNEWHRMRLEMIELGETKPRLTSLGPGNKPTMACDSGRIIFLLFGGAGQVVDSGLWTMRADGTERAFLGEIGRPKISPDGRFVLIQSLARPVGLRLVELATGRVHEIDLPGRKFFSIPTWADNRLIATMSGAETNGAISLIDVTDPAHPKLQADLWTRKDDSDMKPRSPVYSPATEQCYVISRAGENSSSLYVVGKERRGVLRRFGPFGPGEHVEGLALSPGGRYVVFFSDRRDAPAKP